MFDREIPKSGENWKHFKGTNYWIIGIGSYSANFFYIELTKKFPVIYTDNWFNTFKEISIYGNFIARDSETEDLYLVQIEEKNHWILYPAAQTNRESLAWVRPLKNFIEKVNKLEYSGNRFTKNQTLELCTQQNTNEL